MTDETVGFFPLTLNMYMSEDIKSALKAKYADKFRRAEQDGDTLLQMDISNQAWAEYLRMMKRVPKGEYDPVTGKTFTAITTRTTSELLYRHYFGAYPFPRSVVPLLERAVDAYGIGTLSAAFLFWRDKGYNHRNVAGIVNYAKVQYERDEGQQVTQVAKIFLDEETPS